MKKIKNIRNSAWKHLIKYELIDKRHKGDAYSGCHEHCSFHAMSKIQSDYVTSNTKANGYVAWSAQDVNKNSAHGICMMNPLQHSGLYSNTICSFSRSNVDAAFQHFNGRHDYLSLYLFMLSKYIHSYIAHIIHTYMYYTLNAYIHTLHI